MIPGLHLRSATLGPTYFIQGRCLSDPYTSAKHILRGGPLYFNHTNPILERHPSSLHCHLDSRLALKWRLRRGNTNQGRNLLRCQVLGKMAGQVLGKMAGQMLGKMAGQMLGKMAGQVLGKMAGQVLGKMAGQMLDKMAGQVLDGWPSVGWLAKCWMGGQVLGKMGGQVLGKMGGQVLGKMGGQVLGKMGGQVLGKMGGQVLGKMGGQVLGIRFTSTAAVEPLNYGNLLDRIRDIFAITPENLMTEREFQLVNDSQEAEMKLTDDNFLLSTVTAKEELGEDDDATVTQRLPSLREARTAPETVLLITASSPTTSEVSFASSSHHRTVKLPKIELKKFTGEIKDWLGWWAQFNKIHVDPTLEDSDKFQYLVQSMSPGTRASKLVDSYPLTAENYPKVIEILTERFGRPELLQQVYVRDLIRLMIDCSSKQQLKVTSFYDELVTHLRALESLKIEARQMSVFIFPMIEACLSEELMKAWQRSPLHDVKIDANDSTQTRVDLIMEFLQKEAAAEQDRALSGSKFGLKSLKQDRNVGRQSHPAKIPTASGLFAGRAQNCIFCNKDHKNTECLAARRMSIKKRRERIKNAKCCFSCLQPGHISSNCRRRITECIRCKKKHLDILCPLNAPGRESADEDKEQVEDCDVSPTVDNGVSFSSLSASSLILLQTLKIKVEGATSAKVVRVLLDTGSQRSYILSKTAQDLGLSPIGQESLKHVVFGGYTSESVHQEYRVNLGHASGNFKMVAKLLDQKRICGNLPRLNRGPWLKELKAGRIWVPDIGKDDMEIEILLGCDVYVVSLPWTVEKAKIADNREIAMKRLEQTTKKLISLNLYEYYDDIFRGWLDDGIIEKVPAEQHDAEIFYLPQRPVVKLSSGTTPIRPVFDASSKKDWQIHTFVDASSEAYAAVVFLRTRVADKIEVHMMTAKSRVAPVKRPTIPRLELLACVVGARLNKMIFEALELKDIKNVFWSDATTALAWIKRDDQWGTFVGNRVKEMCRLSDLGNWRYAPSECNPADLPSRGCSLSRLIQSRWWEGPSWLKLSKEFWPSRYKDLNEEEICADRKKIAVVTTVKSTDHWYMKYFSSFIKNVRMMAWIRRFINNLRSSTKVKGELSVKVIVEAELALLKLVQAECFPSHSIPGLKGGATPRPRERIVPRDREGSRVTLVSEVGFFLVEVTRRLPMIQGLREEKEKLLKEERRVLKEEEKEKEKLLREEEKEKERLLKEKRRSLKEEEKEKEKLLREEEKERLLKEKRRVLKEKEKEEERLLRQQEREEFHQKAALENNIGEVRTECKRLEIELARMKSLEGAVISPTGRNIPPPTFDGQTSLEGFRRQFEAVTRNNGWGETEKVTNLIVALRGPALDLLRAVPRADQQSYAMLMGELELRYGEQHLRQVYQAQLKLRRQKAGKRYGATVGCVVEQSTTGGGGKSNAIKEILKRLERLEETGRPGRRSAGPCFRCGRHGHLKRQCTVRLPDQRQPGKLNSYNVMDRPGRKHGSADALSRGPCGDCRHCEKIDEHGVTSRRTTMVPSDDWTSESCRTIQQRDPNVGPILEWKERGNERPSWEMISDKSPELKTLWSQWDSLSIENGLLKRIWESADGKSKTMQLVVPKVQVPNVLREIHGGVSGGSFWH
ncbi:hypothetical protein LAZ67_7000901 [Cordylochernes scorpioides]|uniref:CCHC-type domain-containing protein n=1 Tax=Cordylochernes scorpioides TaxID=51811 RepID=A0ABY6KPR5_9ARAC|nr:hypothetical protein LAZ67_7000901 [Cordylochernes scorpioides]